MLEQFRFPGLALHFGFYLISIREQLAGALQELILTMAHMDRSNREVH